MDDATLGALRNILEYLTADEFKHWEESGKPEDHIYIDILRVVQYLDGE